MARPTDKKTLLQAADDGFRKLWRCIDALSAEEQTGTFPFEDRDRNIRDVLVHLYEWHALLLKWVETNGTGNTQPFLPPPYNWRTYVQMNVELWRKHQNTPYLTAREMLTDSHARVVQTIDSFTDPQLFEKQHFSWTGTSSLGSYCISVTSAHYQWAYKKIKRYINAIQGEQQ